HTCVPYPTLFRSELCGRRDAVLNGSDHVTTGSRIISRTGDDEVLPARQRAVLAQRLPARPPHHDRVAHRRALEVLQVLRQVPGHLRAVADDSSGGLRPARRDLHSLRDVRAGQGGVVALAVATGVLFLLDVELRSTHYTATFALITGCGS